MAIRIVRRYRLETSRPESCPLLDTLAAPSRHADFPVGCYCADELRCHRSVLRELLVEHGTEIAGCREAGRGRPCRTSVAS